MLNLKIGFDDFKVLPISDAVSAEKNIDGRINWHRDGVAGDCVILLRATARPRRQAEILIHELLHAALYMAGQEGRRLDEEAICEALDGPLTTIFRDNSELFAVLMQAIHNDTPIVTEEAT